MMNLKNILLITIASLIICLIQIASSFPSNEQNSVLQDQKNDEILKNRKIIKKRSLFQIFSKAQISSNENENFNSPYIDENQSKQNSNISGLFRIFSEAQLDPETSAVNLNKTEFIETITYKDGNISSYEFPKPYPIPSILNYSIPIDPIMDLELVFYPLDIRYQQDYIKITLKYLNQNNTPISENSTTLILSGTFQQRLVFYARNYHHLQVIFKTSDEAVSENINSIGFLMTYKSLMTNLSDSDGLLLSNTTTVLMSKTIKTPINPSDHLTVSKDVFENFAFSFCEALNNLNEQLKQKCDIDSVSEDLLIGRCLNHTSLEKLQSGTCVQLVGSTILKYFEESENAFLPGSYHNPHEDILVLIATIIGLLVISIVIIISLIQTNTCGMKTKCCINSNNSSTDSNDNSICHPGENKNDENIVSFEQSSSDKMLNRENNKSQDRNLEKSTYRLNKTENKHEVERF